MLEYKIILGDSLQVLKTIPESTIDHIITDPPYNISSKTKQTMVGPSIVTAEFGEWDCLSKEEYDKWFEELLKSMHRIAKKGANALIWLDRAYAGVAWFMAEGTGWNPRNLFAAVKKNPVPSRRGKNLNSAWEACLWLSKGPVKTLNTNSQLGLDKNVFFYNIGIDKKTSHPTEKYESMIEPLVEMYTNEGDVVLDPFSGSGTVAVVCKKKNRGCLAIEKDSKWVELTERRIDATSRPL